MLLRRNRRLLAAWRDATALLPPSALVAPLSEAGNLEAILAVSTGSPGFEAALASLTS